MESRGDPVCLEHWAELTEPLGPRLEALANEWPFRQLWERRDLTQEEWDRVVDALIDDPVLDPFAWRCYAVQLRVRGESGNYIESRYGVSRKSSHHWRKQYEQQGLKRLFSYYAGL